MRLTTFAVMTSTMRNCKARRCGDEYHCGWCGLQWDVKDPDPPKCRDNFEVLRELHGLKKREDDELLK